MAHYQLGWYVAQMHDSAERISQQTLGSTQGHFEIATPICMYTIGYSLSSRVCEGGVQLLLAGSRPAASQWMDNSILI